MMRIIFMNSLKIIVIKVTIIIQILAFKFLLASPITKKSSSINGEIAHEPLDQVTQNLTDLNIKQVKVETNIPTTQVTQKPIINIQPIPNTNHQQPLSNNKFEEQHHTLPNLIKVASHEVPNISQFELPGPVNKVKSTNSQPATLSAPINAFGYQQNQNNNYNQQLGLNIPAKSPLRTQTYDQY